MQITKREFLKRLGLGGAALAGGAALGDQAVKTKNALPARTSFRLSTR